MRRFLALLLTTLLFAGCLDESNDEPDTPDEPDDMMMDEEEPAIEDMGEYTLDPATGQCDAKDYDETAPGSYTSGFGGGNWVFVESNGIEGLQYEDNHPGSGTGVGFELAVDDRCTNGDQILV